MDENSLHSESVCSDDTEYLLGQNVSIRDIEDVDLQTPQIPSLKTPPYYGERTLPALPSSKSGSFEKQLPRMLDSVSHIKNPSVKHRDRNQMRHYDSNEHGDSVSHSQRSKRHVDNKQKGEKRPKSPLEVNLESIEVVGNNRLNLVSCDASEQQQSRRRKEVSVTNDGKHLDSKSNQSSKRKPSPVRNPEKGHREIHIKSNTASSDKTIKHTENFIAHRHQHVSQYSGVYGGGSPEVVDVGSIASEVTEDLVHGDEQLDGSVIEKLKQLNLAVNYDEEHGEFCDDKVKEGAELLSKLFGGAVDNYYSSPSLRKKIVMKSLWTLISSNSGQSKSFGSPGTESGSKVEDRVDLSNSSSKLGSFSSRQYIASTAQPAVSPSRKKGKVSFATDESSSFDSSYHISSKGQLASPKQYGEPFDHAPSNRSDITHSAFVRETSALRAAMDYGDESGQHSNSFEQEASPSFNPVLHRDTNGGRVPKYDLEYNEHHNAEEDEYVLKSSKNRYQTERYSERSHQAVDIPGMSPGRSQHEFTTSTPHKNRQKGSSYQDTKEDVERKTLYEKKLKELEDKLSQSIQELRDVQFDIEEAASRKQMALQEVQLLEDTLKRTKADIISSENLAEEYRRRATQARTELMDFEIERDSTQQEIRDLSTLLERQKQETHEAIKVERKNEKKVLELTLEKEKLIRERETSKSRLEQLEVTLRSEKESYNDRISQLQDRLIEEQRSSKENMDRLKEQLENERQIARDSHFERIQAIHKLQDEAKDVQEKEIEAVRLQMTRELEVEMEKIQDKARRDVETLTRQLQDSEFRTSDLQKSLRDQQEEIEHLKQKLRNDKEKLYDSEQTWKEALEKQEAYSRALKAEVDNLKIREVDILEKQRHIEESLDEKSVEIRRLNEKSFSQTEESTKILENKDGEIEMLRSLVRQQEDATRHLGEKMRNEAQEHALSCKMNSSVYPRRGQHVSTIINRSALKKERDTMEKERARHNQKLDEKRTKYEDILRQTRTELEDERDSKRQFQNALHKMKLEMEKFRQLHLQTQEEKVNAIAEIRTKSKEHISRLKDKIEEITLMSDKIERDTVMEINEECQRVAAILGGSPNTTPVKTSNMSTSFNGESPCSSPTREALANLRSCNAELRQNLLEARRELEVHNNTPSKTEPSTTELTHQQLAFFKKALKTKEDEIARLKRQLQEESSKGTLQMRAERVAFQKTIDRLEKELKQARKVGSQASSPRVNGLLSPPDSTSGLGTSLSSTASPTTANDSSTTKLLRHLQGRVQQLRAQNESLRSDSLNDSQTSIYSSVDSFQDDREKEDELVQTKTLQEALQQSDQRAQKNAAILSQKMMEMTKLQKMLTHATKENMKLERAYASLQRKVIDSST